MPTLSSQLSPQDPLFQRNVQQMQQLVSELNTHLQSIQQGGSETARAKHLARHKLLPRERIEKITDLHSHFLELSPLAGHALYKHALPCGGLITGIGRIHGRDTMIVVNDPTIKAGSYHPITVKKHLRAQAIALDNHLPCVYLVDSAGAYLPEQAELFADEHHFGAIFYREAQLSAQGIPQIAVVLGSCTAGGAYVPAMADECIMVQQQSTLFLAGPPLVQAATGEVVTAEALGGADLHCRHSGVADYYAHNEQEALEQARQIVKRLSPHRTSPRTHPTSQPPQVDPLQLYGAIPCDTRQPYAAKEIIARLVDDSYLDEFKALYGTTLVCGFAHIDGYLVGILANNGILLSEAALKATHFIQLCCQRHIPLVFLHNVTGFMVGQHYEATGITKHGAKMIRAVACANVPKWTIITGGSFGAGNYAMCGRAYRPHFLWSWPNARISIMGKEQAAFVLSHLQQKSKDSNPSSVAALQESIKQQYTIQGHPYYASARLWDDGVIDPLDTRRLLARALSIAYPTLHQQTAPSWGVFRM